MLSYVPKLEKIHNPEIGSYSSFGIAVYQDKKLILFVSAISTEEALVTNLAMHCSQQQLSPTHLYDVIEDFLG